MHCYLFLEALSGRIVYLTDNENDPGPSDTFLVTPEGRRTLARAQLERHAFEGELPAGIHPQNCARHALRDGHIVEVA